MARTYKETRGEFLEVEARRAEANTDALKTAVDNLPIWSVSRTAAYVNQGKPARQENRTLAIALLHAGGKGTPSDKEIKSQMKSIQRWKAAESGSKSQSRKPSAASQKLLNKVGRNQKLAKDGFTVKLDGEIAVNGYKRSRKAAVDVEGEDALRFFDDPNYQDLGRAYLGGSDALYGFGDDLQVELDTLSLDEFFVS